MECINCGVELEFPEGAGGVRLESDQPLGGAAPVGEARSVVLLALGFLGVLCGGALRGFQFRWSLLEAHILPQLQGLAGQVPVYR